MPASRPIPTVLCRVALLATLATPSVAAAQVPDTPYGYVIGHPRGTLTLRGGFARPNATSDVFAFTSQHLTLNKGDFGGAAFAVDAGMRFGKRFEAVFGTGVANRNIQSNYRDFVDNDDAEIKQQTTFRRVPLNIGVKYYLKEPGRSLGRYAWMPARFVPYVAAGAGGVYYRFEQEGDFVDFESLDVFNAKLSSSGWGAAAYGAGGVNYSIGTRASLVTEARYDMSKAQMVDGFYGFDKIDLSGVSVTAGIQFRF